jgi:DNA-directed RNA polymerase specialized sigma24 family protein
MGRHEDIVARRLRRLARALVSDVDCADQLVLETLTAAEASCMHIHQLFAILIARRRERETLLPRVRPPAPKAQPDILRAFEALPLVDREALALVVVEQLEYEDAARILDVPLATFISRLTQARATLARLAEGDRQVVLRLVKG